MQAVRSLGEIAFSPILPPGETRAVLAWGPTPKVRQCYSTLRRAYNLKCRYKFCPLATLFSIFPKYEQETVKAGND
jgi:hypothetical protein